MRRQLASLLLGAGVGVGVASLFPVYLSGASLAGSADSLAGHVLPLAGWSVAAVLVAAAPEGWSLAGALAGVGLALVEAGLLFADAGAVIAQGAHVGGAGLVLALVSWLLATCGSILGLGIAPLRAGIVPGAASPRRLAAGIAGSVGAVAAAALFAPPWDHFVVTLASTGRVSSFTAGNAFANPAPVIAGNVLAMVAIAAAGVAGALARSARLGGALVAGVAVALSAQVASAVAQWTEPVPPSFFGLSAGRAAALGYHATLGLTVVFYLFCAAAALLAVLATARLLAAGDRATARRPLPAAPRRAFVPTPHY